MAPGEAQLSPDVALRLARTVGKPRRGRLYQRLLCRADNTRRARTVLLHSPRPLPDQNTPLLSSPLLLADPNVNTTSHSGIGH